MNSAGHVHPVDAKSVAKARRKSITPSQAGPLAELLGLLSDPVRLRTLFCLAEVSELCVGDVALALGVNADQSSYALRSLKAARLAQARRDGRVMFYRLADGFPQELLNHCLHRLLTLSTEQAR